MKKLPLAIVLFAAFSNTSARAGNCQSPGGGCKALCGERGSGSILSGDHLSCYCASANPEESAKQTFMRMTNLNYEALSVCFEDDTLEHITTYLKSIAPDGAKIELPENRKADFITLKNDRISFKELVSSLGLKITFSDK